MSGDQADEGGGGVLKASSGMIDAGFPFEGGGRARETWDWRGDWRHLACHADMASSLADSAWNASV